MCSPNEEKFHVLDHPSRIWDFCWIQGMFLAHHIVKNYIAAQLHNMKVPLILGRAIYFFSLFGC
jgi:hypothetical protein